MAKELTPRNLLEAAASGDVGEVMKLLDVSSADQSEIRENRVAGINVRDCCEWTAVHLAVEEDSNVAIATLARAGADINLPDKWNYTPLQLAVRMKRTSCVGELINLGADIDCVTIDELNPLMLAAKSGQEDCLQLLLKAGAGLDLQFRQNSSDYFGRTALMLAAEHHEVDCLKLLLEAGADVNVKTSDGETALHYACKCSDKLKDAVILGCVKILLSFGADVTMISSKGQTVLMYAVRRDCQVHILSILVEAGVVIDQQDFSGMTALAHAVSTGSHACVLWLVDHGASVNVCDYSGKTLLHFLMFDSDNDTAAMKCAELLLSKRLDVNATDKDGMTPLMCVARKSETRTGTMATLLEHGAELNVMDNKGQTALIHSLGLGSPLPDPPFDYNYRFTSGIKFLIDKGANPSQGHIASHQLSSLVFLQRDLDLIKFHVGSTVDLKAEWDQFVAAFSQNKRKILQFLIINGVMPSLPGPHNTPNRKDVLLNTSLLESAAVWYNLGVVKYFIATCYLRDEDLKFSNREHVRKHDVFKVMDNLRSQPWPLVKLCFVVVSTAFGASPGRQERVKNSQLPVKLQKMLLFQEPWSRLCVHQWDNIHLTFSPNEYEKLPRSRPLLYHWPVGRALVPCDCGGCDGTMYKYEETKDDV